METIKYPSDQELIERYRGIESKANQAIKAGQVIGNPMLRGLVPDTRYSISAQGYIRRSLASRFLIDAITDLRCIEPSTKSVEGAFLHLTLQEAFYNPRGRAHSGVKAERASEYYCALRQNLPDHDSVRLKLDPVFPTLDAPLPGFDLPSVSVVGAFLTEGDNAIFQIRDDIAASIQQANLPFAARLGTIKVIFVTLGRLVNPPTEAGKPLLKTLDDINKNIPKGCHALIDSIDLISTTRISYPYPYGHVFMSPPISLNTDRRSDGPMRFQTPSQRQSQS